MSLPLLLVDLMKASLMIPAMTKVFRLISRIVTVLKQKISAHSIRVRAVFFGGAVLVGLIAALFALGSNLANASFHALSNHSPLLPFIITPLGLVLIVWLTRRFFPGAEGSGIPQTIATIEMTEHQQRAGLLSLRTAFGKIVLTIGGLLAGASIGREGPTVHVGAAIMYSLGTLARFPAHYIERGLVMAGGAAGIAAATNTPLAGIMFAIEEMSRSFQHRASGTLITAVAIAGITALALHGNYTYFGLINVEVNPLGPVLLAVLVCGIVSGILGSLFSLILLRGTHWIKPFQLKAPLWVAAICGLVIAIVGFASDGHSHGTGYDEAKQLLAGDTTIGMEYSFYKMLATIASYLSGIPGGIFAPSLSAGAGIGTLVSPWFTSLPVTVIIILCMVGFFTAVLQTPLTAIILVMEMTASQTVLLPIMLTAFIAYGVAKIINPDGLYRKLALPFIEQAAIKTSPPAPKDTQNLP
jgi:H+/Cl- antiporter ClcA